MRLSDLYRQLNAAGNLAASTRPDQVESAPLRPPIDLDSFELYLAAPDEDGTDVDLTSVGHVEVDYEKAEARFYPASTATAETDSDDPEPFLGMVLEQFPPMPPAY